MKIKNKIISMLCAVSMVMATMSALTVSAATAPLKISLDTAVSEDGTAVDFTLSYTEFADAAISGLSGFITLDGANFGDVFDGSSVKKKSGSVNATWNAQKNAIACTFMASNP